MCNYCDKLFSGDYGEDINTVDVEVNEIKLFGLQTYITDFEGKVYLRMDLIDGFAQILACGKNEIHYCPICGRKLVKES